ncbi:LAT2 domain-containing protein isoform X4 [Syngnathus scovelli]|uniref:LAT2 domain-containing protein isoform X4 n=1 Tax=Syngnathus scovelli TaxID=161590 RepID=UPI00210FAA6E|nr:uncharacterized protein LOC125982207 isoform X3 [Syngnathus scovelli]
MLGNSSLQCAVGGVASLALLSLLGLLCLRCKTKSKIHEEAEIYNSHTFQREGSIFAVMRSKTVTKANQMTPSINEDVYPATYSVAGSPTGYWEHIYVEPLPVTVYENEHLRTKDCDGATAHYANYAGGSPANYGADDYENFTFLAHNARKLENDNWYEN